MTTLEQGVEGTPALDLRIEPVVLVEIGGDGDNVVDDGNPFSVSVSWIVTPPNVAVLLTGTWRVRVYVESVGPGPEQLLGQVTVAASGVTNYAASLTVPAGALPSNANPVAASGVYRTTAVLSYETSLNAKTEITAFQAGPHFMIRTP